MRKKLKVMVMSLCFFLTIFTVSFVWSSQDSFPNKPIMVVVPYNPGGGADITARIFSKYSKEYLGQPLVVKNITGAAGAVGSKAVKDAKPDGYTLLWHANAFHASFHAGVGEFRFDDLTPICQTVYASDVIVARNEAPWNDISELMEFIRKNPGEVKMGVNIGATTYYVGVEMAFALQNYECIRYVAGGGDSDRTTKLLGGHTDITPIVTATVMDYLESGKLKALASTAPERNRYLPNVPTFREKGYDVTSIKHFYAFGPPGLPKSIEAKIANAFEKMCQDERIVEELDKLKMEAQYSTGNELIAKMLEQDAKFYKLSRIEDIIKKSK